MTFRYLNQQGLDELFSAVVHAGLNDLDTLRQMTTGISPGFRGALPAAGTPNVILLGTLNKLNETEKLVGGEVPFSIWLKNATRLTMGMQQETVFREKLDNIMRSSSGEPSITGIDGLPELKPEVQERIVHYNDMVPFGFLRRGHQAGLAVARVEVPRYINEELQLINATDPNITRGTGWLVTPDIVITNQHVIKARPDNEQPNSSDLRLQVENMLVRFDYESEGEVGLQTNVVKLLLADIDLDFALLRLASIPGDPASGQWKRKPLAITRDPLLLDADSGKRIPVNIIQHPLGDPKQLACRNNRVSMGDDKTLRYFTDTRSGSSGSPVCNDDWEVVALHRASTDVKGVSFHGMPVPWVNVGTQISTILEYIEHKDPALLQEISATQKTIGASAWVV